MNDIFRNLLHMARRFKTATALNFIGLTVAFASCYLFLTQVTYNHSYNRGLTDYENLYRVEVGSMFNEGEWQTHVSRMIADELAGVPQVTGMALLEGWTSNSSFRKGDEVMSFKLCPVNNDALTTLAPRLLDGELGWKDGDTQGLVIPASVARTYFGKEQAAGLSMCMGEDSLTVRGVFEDFPENSFAGNMVYCCMGDENKGNFSNYNYNCYVRLVEQADTAAINRTVNESLTKALHQMFIDNGAEDQWESQGSKIHFRLRFRPVTETWFSGVDGKDRGNAMVDGILQVACLLVLIIAAINFLNFTLAESPMRIKSINTRRVLGSSLASLRWGLVAESVVTSLTAFALAVGVCWLLGLWPTVAELTVGSIALSDHPLLLAAIGLAAVAVGVAAGVYPAFYATSFQPALVLKGSFGLSPKGRHLRTALLCLQFVITCLMVVYIGILFLQSRYIYSSDYGFAKDEVLYASVRDLVDRKDALRSELMQQPGVVDVSFSQSLMGSDDEYMSWGRGDKEHHVTFTVLPVDWHYLTTMGIQIVEGRNFTEHDGDCYIINEAARRQWDWVEMEKPLLEDELTVVGVCENVRFASTRVDNSTAPMAFVVFGKKYEDWGDSRRLMNVRVAAGIDKVEMRKRIQDICVKLGAERAPKVRFLDEVLEYTYEEEFRFIRQVMIFSIICFIITLIGVFCLTMFETEYRRKEIGIRKVMGSSTHEILLIFCRHYALLLTVSFLIAVPVAIYIGQQWLQSFAERTPIHWWLFPLALLIVAAVTLATVITQSWRTANENPINSIKTE